MTVTRSQLRSAIRTQMKVDPRGKIWNDTELNDSITDSIDQVSVDNDYKWEELKKTWTDTTITDQQEYDLPDDFVTLDLVRLDGNVLETSKYDELKAIYKTFPSWTPIDYYSRDYKLWLNPIPTATWTAIDYEYRASAPVMTLDADTMIFKDNMKRTVVLQAAWLLFSKYSDEKNIRRAQNTENQYEKELGKAKKRNALPDIAQMHYKTAYIPRTGSSRTNDLRRRFGIY